MENSSVPKKADAQAGAFRFRYLCTKSQKKGLNICPADASANRPLKNETQRLLVLCFHEGIISFFDIIAREKHSLSQDYNNPALFLLLSAILPARQEAVCQFLTLNCSLTIRAH